MLQGWWGCWCVLFAYFLMLETPSEEGVWLITQSLLYSQMQQKVPSLSVSLLDVWEADYHPLDFCADCNRCLLGWPYQSCRYTRKDRDCWLIVRCVSYYDYLEIRFIIVPYPLSNEIYLICCFTSVIVIIPLLKCNIITRLTVQSSHCSSKVVLSKLFELRFEIVILIHWYSFKNEHNIAIICDVHMFSITRLEIIMSRILRFEFNPISFLDLFSDDTKIINCFDDTLNRMSVMHMLSRKCHHPNRCCFHVLMLYNTPRVPKDSRLMIRLILLLRIHF